jgi:hypothetical protein
MPQNWWFANAMCLSVPCGCAITTIAFLRRGGGDNQTSEPNGDELNRARSHVSVSE